MLFVIKSIFVLVFCTMNICCGYSMTSMVLVVVAFSWPGKYLAKQTQCLNVTTLVQQSKIIYMYLMILYWQPNLLVSVDLFCNVCYVEVFNIELNNTGCIRVCITENLLEGCEITLWKPNSAVKLS